MLLEIKDLEVFFKSSQGIVKAVNKVNINTRDGKTTAIVGESGSGKSVTTLAIMGLLDKSSLEKISGEINFEGKNLLEATPEELRKIRGNEISMIFQEPMTSLNPALKVGYQMSEVFRSKEISSTAFRTFFLPRLNSLFTFLTCKITFSSIISPV